MKYKVRVSALKDEAFSIIRRLCQENQITYAEYCTVFDALDEIPTIREQSAILEDLWSRFIDIPMNPETECIEAPFIHFTAGTHREEIWHWFNERYSKGVYALLYEN